MKVLSKRNLFLPVSAFFSKLAHIMTEEEFQIELRHMTPSDKKKADAKYAEIENKAAEIASDVSDLVEKQTGRKEPASIARHRYADLGGLKSRPCPICGIPSDKDIELEFEGRNLCYWCVGAFAKKRRAAIKASLA